MENKGRAEMNARRGWWLAAIGLAALTAAAASVLGTQDRAAATADPKASGSALALITSYLTSDNGIFGTVSVPLAPQLPARAFCSVRIIDSQLDGSQLRVGTIVYCGEYARRGGSLLSGESAQEAVVLTLSPATAPTGVTAVLYEPDDAPPSWFSANYTSAGSAEIQSILIGSANSNLTDPSVEARAAFGLTASAPLDVD